MTDFDVIVVGAGPSGATTALEAARAGMSVLLLDKAGFPRNKVCAGGISPRAISLLKRLELFGQVAELAYPVSGVKLIRPRGEPAILKHSACILPRLLFDEIIVKAAVKAGAKLRDSTVVDDLFWLGDKVSGVVCGTERITADWVVVANGAHTRFNRDERPKEILQTCMAWFDGLSFEPGLAEMIFDPELAPHYGWMFPESDSRANIGICLDQKRLGRQSIRDLFARFLERRYGDRLGSARQVGLWKGHPIVTTLRVHHHAAPGVLLVGEANRMTNRLSGEGIAYALHSGVLASRAIVKAKLNGWDPSRTARWYSARLRLAMEPAFATGWMFQKLSSGTLDHIIEKVVPGVPAESERAEVVPKVVPGVPAESEREGDAVRRPRRPDKPPLSELGAFQ